jgi:hypothetical protein
MQLLVCTSVTIGSGMTIVLIWALQVLVWLWQWMCGCSMRVGAAVLIASRSVFEYRLDLVIGLGGMNVLSMAE